MIPRRTHDRAARARLPLIAGLLALTLLPFGHASRAGEVPVHSFELDNGLRAVVIEDHRAPVVTHMVWYRVGGIDEKPGKSGLAHFLEHLMFKGTKTVPPGELSKIVARNGGRDNAFTSQDYTAYFQTIAADRLGLVMKLEADRMANLNLTPQTVGPELAVVIEERRMRIDNNPAALLSEQMTAAQYLALHYRVPLIGWPDELRRLTTDDAIAWYKGHYAPNNAILVVAGDVTPDQVRTLAEKYYGPVPRRELPVRWWEPEPKQIAARRVVLKDPRARQPQWRRSYLAPALNTPQRKHIYALDLLAEILGGGPTSRLYRALVVTEKLASSASASYDETSLDWTTFGLYATPRPGGDVGAVEKAADAVIAAFLEAGPTAQELVRAKRSLSAAAIYSRDSSFGMAQIFGSTLASGGTIADVTEWPARIEAVTAEQVLAAARAVLRPARSVTGILLPKKPEKDSAGKKDGS